MSSVFALLAGIIASIIIYKIFVRHIDSKVIVADSKKATPATLYMDGVDYIPASKHVLFGYQFKTIAALGPVIGPIIAVQWGWLPALLWLIGGAIFLGWVHDYMSAFLALRNDGQSFGALSYRLISPRARLVLLAFIYFYLLLVVAAFGNIVAKMMSNISSVPIAIIALMITGVLAGYLIYRKRMDIMVVTVGMVILALFSIWLGTKFGITGSMTVWIIYALFFSYLGAVLPIWSYAQPINYISFYLVLLGMIGATLGVIIGRPSFTTPSFISFNVEGLGPLWPILFVTIACGAISGWHSLVSSSGTARQLENEKDCCYVTAGSMLLEMILGVLALIMAAATFSNFAAYKAALEQGGPANVFSVGMSNLLSTIGIPTSYGTAFAGAIFVILAITVMQIVVRFMRLATSEMLGDRAPIMRNVHVGTFIALLLAFILIKSGTWTYIWILFGGSNQLMAALALLLATVWLVKEGRSYLFTLIPMIFMFITTIAALGYTCNILFKNTQTAMKAGKGMIDIIGNAGALIIGIFLIVSALILAYDGMKAFFRYKNEIKPVKGEKEITATT